MGKVAVGPAPPASTTTTTTTAKPRWGWKQRAAQFFCLLILFGFPIFSVPCHKGACVSPLEVVTTYMYAKQMVPDEWTTALLYPATLMLNAEILMGDSPESFQFPPLDSILRRWNLTADIVEDERTAPPASVRFVPNLLSMFEASNPTGLNWEFVGACVTCLLGALLSVFGPNKISFWGVLLVLWFIFLEGGKREDVFVQPMFGLALICSIGWVNFKDLFSLPREGEPPEAAAQPKVESKKD